MHIFSHDRVHSCGILGSHEVRAAAGFVVEYISKSLEK